MDFLKCNNCGQLNEVKTEYLTFCTSCNKKMDNNFCEWKKNNADKSFDDYKKIICVTDTQDSLINKPKLKRNRPKGLKYLIGFVIAFAIFYLIGHFAGDAIVGIFKKPAYDKVMMKVADELNKTCPVMIDEETRLDNAIALPDNIFQYNYTLVNMDKASADIVSIRNILEPNLINFVKTSPQMKIMRDKNTTLNYHYRDKNGIFLFLISINPDKYKE